MSEVVSSLKPIIKFFYNVKYVSTKESMLSDTPIEEIILLLHGRDPTECDFEIVFDIDWSELIPTGLCKCTGHSVPLCRSCQRGKSKHTKLEIDQKIYVITYNAQSRFDEKIKKVKDFFLACKDFAIFLSLSSNVLLETPDVKKTKALSFDLGCILERYMTKCQKNPLSQVGKMISLKNLTSLFWNVRIQSSSRRQCDDISIRGELLGLSLTMKLLCRFASLCHLNNNCHAQMVLIHQIADYICRMSFRRQMRRRIYATAQGWEELEKTLRVLALES